MKSLLLLVAPVLVLGLLTVHGASDFTTVQQWQILTKQNFSSQIRLHHHILLLVTLPWSGESRSLTKEVAELVSDRVESFGSLKLRLVHKNSENLLSESIGSTADDITIFYYHYSVSYKYRGRLRAKNILDSLYPHMSLASEEVPLKALKTPEELKDFTDSTDEALVLFEFCGWTPKLLSKEKNGTENVDSLSGNLLRVGFSRKTDRMLVTRRRNNQKVAGQEMCQDDIGVAKGFGGLPWLGQFSTENGSNHSDMIDGRWPQISSSCSYKEFQRFHSFYSNFMMIVREYYLPPEKHRFGLVSETSLLSSLDIADSGTWFVMRYVSGCPSCLKILKEESDLKYVSQTDNFVVKELEGSGYDLMPVLPPNLPSVLLFVDRSSDFPEVRETSREALSALRELASFYKAAPKICQNNGMDQKSSFQMRGMESESKHPKLKLSLTGHRNKLVEKRSTFMIVDENQRDHFDKITTDLSGGSLHDILTYFFQQKKGKKLSSMAKNLGFQLLSEDMEIKFVNSEQLQALNQFNQLVPDTVTEGILANYRQMDDDSVTKPAVKPERNIILTDVEVSSQQNEVKANPVEDNNQGIVSVEAQKFISNDEPSLVANEKGEEEPPILEKKLISDKEPLPVANGKDEEHPVKGPKLISNDEPSLLANEKREDEPYVQEKELREEHYESICFNGSFFFSDGDYRLLNSLSGASRIPALVIVDPIKHHHHVFPAEMNFSYALIHDYLSTFVSGSLLPHVRSEFVLQSPRQTIYPPFVNLDFHEVDSVPRVTSNTFTELAIGFNQSQNERAFLAWSNDVLVLFTNSWCGFCQRMELVVRELYRAIKGYEQMVYSRHVKDKTVPISGADKRKDPNVKLPMVYLIDCTLNDCSLILKSIHQREAYPALLLFPAEKKNPVLYEGDMAVADIIQFVSDHGNNSHHLINEKALWMPKTGGWNDKSYEEVSQLIHREVHLAKSIPEEATVEVRTRGMELGDDQIKSLASDGLQERSSHVVVGSILIASENLLGSQPFDQSKILIVAAERMEGFQGLIINKKLEWNVLNELEGGLEILKEAPLSFGGPLIKQGMPLVSLTRRFHRKSVPEIHPGIYFLDQSATIGEFESLKSGNQSVSDYWFFLGYSSWGWDQLFHEIEAGAWNVSFNITAHLNWP